MKKRSLLPLIAVALFTLSFSPPAEGRGKKPVLEPGQYKEWGEDIDAIEIVKNFKYADYDSIVVTKFDTSSTPMPETKEKSYKSVKTVLDGFTETLTEALRDEVKGKVNVEQMASAPKTSKTLIVRGKVDEISPGSRAGRMLVGYGAGSSGTQITGEIVDAKSGKVLARFTQKRRSGGTFKFAGGSDVQIMRDSIHALGQDIAHIVRAFE